MTASWYCQALLYARGVQPLRPSSLQIQVCRGMQQKHVRQGLLYLRQRPDVERFSAVDPTAVCSMCLSVLSG